MIPWDKKYEIGIVHIDEQHKKLFQYLNDMESAVTDRDVSDAFLSGAFDYFENYIRTHFNAEEACMYRYRCPAAEKNQVAHRHFMEFFSNYKKIFEMEGASYQLYTEILDFCEKWILQHICKIDLQLKSALEKS